MIHISIMTENVRQTKKFYATFLTSLSPGRQKSDRVQFKDNCSQQTFIVCSVPNSLVCVGNR